MSRVKVARPYEPSDIHTRNVLWTAAVLVGTIVLVQAIVYGLIVWFHGASATSPFLHNSVPGLPADLQQYAVPTLDEFRRREQQTLETYGRVDPRQNIARVPIERAIELYVQAHRGERLGQGSAQARCDIPTYTPGVTGCNLVFLPSVLPSGPGANAPHQRSEGGR